MCDIIPFVDWHRNPTRSLLERTGFFREDEIDTAIEVIDIYLSKKDDYRIYTAIQEGDVAGYVCFGKTPVTLSTYDLYWIAVAPEFQRCGIGGKLFTFAWSEVLASGGKLLVIETSSQLKYQHTRDFYERQGSRLEARIKDFYKEDDDLMVYIKRI